MRKAEPSVSRSTVERQFKEMSARGGPDMALVSDDRGFCWKSAGNHFDPDVMAALPSVLGDAVRTGRLRLRYFAGGKAGFDIDGADVRALLQEAGLESGLTVETSTGYPAWLLTVTPTGSNGGMEFTLSANQGRAVIRTLDSRDCNLFLVGVFSNAARDKGALELNTAALCGDLERILAALNAPAVAAADRPKVEQVAAILTGLREADPSIRAVALHMDDGLVVASSVSPGADADTLAAIAAGILHSCRLVGGDALGGSPQQICFQGEAGTLIGTSIREDLLLTVLLEPGAEIGIAETLARHAADRMAGVIAPQALTKSQEV